MKDSHLQHRFVGIQIRCEYILDGFQEDVGVISMDSLNQRHPEPSGSHSQSGIYLGDNRNGWRYRGLEGGLRGGLQGGYRRGFTRGSRRGEEGGRHGEPHEARVAHLSAKGALAAIQMAAVVYGGVVRVGGGVLAAGD